MYLYLLLTTLVAIIISNQLINDVDNVFKFKAQNCKYLLFVGCKIYKIRYIWKFELKIVNFILFMQCLHFKL